MFSVGKHVLNHPDICGGDSIAGHSEGMGDNFLTLVMEKPMGEDALLELVLKTKEGLLEDMEVGSSLDAVTMRWWSSGS